jgi:apolipoprotein D and lipocalin family protein
MTNHSLNLPSAMAFAALLACAAMPLQAAAQAQQTVAIADGGTPPLPIERDVDLQRYAGLWYEQARLPNTFQRDCAEKVTAYYAPRKSGVLVVNRCIQADGTAKEAKGMARRVEHGDAPNAGQLEVRFAPRWLSWFPGVWGDYAVIALDPDYRVALVGTPNREYLWLLSREPKMADKDVAAWLAKAQSVGFDTGRVTRTPQSPDVTAAGTDKARRE